MVYHEKYNSRRWQDMNNIYKELNKNIEIQHLIQDIEKDEYAALEENIFDNGCLNPILIWNNTIIDGHKRYDLCCKWSIPFSTRSIPFKELCDVFAFICMQQLHRQDLTLEYRKYLLGRLYQAETEISARDFMLSNPTASEHIDKSLSKQPYNKYTTAMKIGKDYHISHGTVLKYSVYAKSLDSIRCKEEILFKRILMGNLKVSHDNVIELSRLPKEDLRCLKTVMEENNMDKIGYSEIRHELQWKRLPTSPPKKKPKYDPAIRKIPKYDPDAEISSLTLTIPSWISSIKRSCGNTDFHKISASARKQLIHHLSILKRTIENIEKTIEEEKPNGRITE